eukprot:TRINITY_DN71751_c0_g1_i1.p1 TRINITY_DN71751_c0_g1~~TRINITY_DN71751_c0_g1_i1.p1  ORF type:complete len:357 (+),score=85.55 TRINITY_DN71751_c0_g1_i1:76-1071(+)
MEPCAVRRWLLLAAAAALPVAAVHPTAAVAARAAASASSSAAAVAGLEGRNSSGRTLTLRAAEACAARFGIQIPTANLRCLLRLERHSPRPSEVPLPEPFFRVITPDGVRESGFYVLSCKQKFCLDRRAGVSHFLRHVGGTEAMAAYIDWLSMADITGDPRFPGACFDPRPVGDEVRKSHGGRLLLTYMGHYYVYIRMLAEGMNTASIIEDDARIGPGVGTRNFRQRFAQAVSDTPADFDFLFTGGCFGIRGDYRVRGEVWRTRAKSRCALGYVVSARGACHMLSSGLPQRTMIDHAMNYVGTQTRNAVYFTEPTYFPHGLAPSTYQQNQR